ncbi:MAG: RnfABCDGE type electron transport complex subunit D [Desulfobacterales bacterium]|jgi:electron transport complex protein RnfD|nr:RnfABCDGE type electron transport complex subunit D [Desulfobacterales bacterium]
MKEPGFVVAVGPHIHSGNSVRDMMLHQIIALLPAVAAAFLVFGADTLRVAAIAMGSAVFWDAVLQKLFKRSLSIGDLSAAAGGLVLAMLLPATVPWWVVVLGTLVMLLLGKHVYGGLGCNPFNGVLIAYVALLLSYPGLVGDYPVPTSDMMMTQNSPLLELKDKGAEFLDETFPLQDLFLGSTLITGTIGEVSKLALLLGGLFLVLRRKISWIIPAGFLSGLAGFAAVFWLIDPETYASPLFHLLAGGSLLGAFFLATDWTTSPVTKTGMALFGLVCGVMTMAIRLWSQWPEGAYFAVFMVSMLTPFFDKLRPKVFGSKFGSHRQVQF